ncbi:MAG: hypothetical protein AB7U82_31050 [Blastocatellales bacterium]
MARRKLTEILIETVETIIIRRRQTPDAAALTAWCPECGREVSLISPEAAAKLAGVNIRAIYRQIEAGRLHFIETTDALLICVDSAMSIANAK